LAYPAVLLVNSLSRRLVQKAPVRSLVVDDSVLIRHAVRVLLESRAGYEVCGEAADGVEALEQAVALKPDLIILDLSMPRMNGLEAAAILHQNTPRVPIILFTMHLNALSTQDAKDAGVSSVVFKCGRTEALLAEVDRLLSTVQ
jgi:DNA-binding NarL/FixJ family response regulator